LLFVLILGFTHGQATGQEKTDHARQQEAERKTTHRRTHPELKKNSNYSTGWLVRRPAPQPVYLPSPPAARTMSRLRPVLSSSTKSYHFRIFCLQVISRIPATLIDLGVGAFASIFCESLHKPPQSGQSSSTIDSLGAFQSRNGLVPMG
jgi:hypothetical protein